MKEQLQRIAAALEALAVDVGEIREAIVNGKPPKPPKPKNEAVLTGVPWLSQLGKDAAFAPGDCGPACTAMWLRYLGHNFTVDDCSKATGLAAGYRYTMPAHLLNIMRNLAGVETYWRKNLTLEDLAAEADAGAPCIVLVEYDHLPASVRYDPTYKFGHWILVVGYSEIDGQDVMVYHDPYYADSTGAFVTITDAAFYEAWGTNSESGNSNFQAIRARR